VFLWVLEVLLTFTMQRNPEIASSLYEGNYVHSMISLVVVVQQQPLDVLMLSRRNEGEGGDADEEDCDDISETSKHCKAHASHSISCSKKSLGSWANHISDAVVLILVESSKKVIPVNAMRLMVTSVCRIICAILMSNSQMY
jgi:hypothetical protein